MNREQAKKILKIAAVIYVLSFVIINWNDISWIFNYRAATGLIGDFFNPYPSIGASAMDDYFYPNHSQNTEDGLVKNVKTTYTDKQNTLEVPKLSLSVSIIFSESKDEKTIIKDLDSGVVYYPGSVYPGQVGQIIILGHSAPDGWPKIKHDWVFSDLDQLKPGDQVFVDLNNKQYPYIVKKTTIIKKGADVPTEESDGKGNTLVLISCWPPGKDYQRIAVETALLTLDN